MAKAKLYYTKSKYLPTLPISNGNIIFVPDINTVCLDMSNERFLYQTIKVFETEEERAAVPFPNVGFYYVTDTNVLWRWENGWARITPTNLTPNVYRESEEDFPQEGNEGTLYYTDEGIYNWKENSNEYNLIANANKWNGIS